MEDSLMVDKTPTTNMHEIMKDIIAMVDVRAERDNRSEIFEIRMQELGAKIVKKISDNPTHLIFMNGSLRTLNLAMKKNISIVNVLWIKSSRENGKKEDEKDYPIIWTEKKKDPDDKIWSMRGVKEFGIFKSYDGPEYARFLERQKTNSEPLKKKLQKKLKNKYIGKNLFPQFDIEPLEKFKPIELKIPITPPNMRRWKRRLALGLDPGAASDEDDLFGESASRKIRTNFITTDLLTNTPQRNLKSTFNSINENASAKRSRSRSGSEQLSPYQSIAKKQKFDNSRILGLETPASKLYGEFLNISDYDNRITMSCDTYANVTKRKKSRFQENIGKSSRFIDLGKDIVSNLFESGTENIEKLSNVSDNNIDDSLKFSSDVFSTISIIDSKINNEKNMNILENSIVDNNSIDKLSEIFNSANDKERDIDIDINDNENINNLNLYNINNGNCLMICDKKYQQKTDNFIITRKMLQNTHENIIQMQPKKLIVMTSLHSNEQMKVKDCVKEFGEYEISDNVTSSFNLVVSGECRRTIKIIQAILKGCYIVSFKWIEESFARRQWMPFEDYETNFFPSARCNRIKRGTEENFKVEIFNQCGAIFISSNCHLSKLILEDLVKNTGGKVVDKISNCEIFVAKKSKKLKNAVSEKWILDSICGNKCLSLTDYILP